MSAQGVRGLPPLLVALAVAALALLPGVSACGGGDAGGDPSTDLVSVGDCLLHGEGSADPTPVACGELHDFEVILLPSEQACIELSGTDDIDALNSRESLQISAVSEYAGVPEDDARQWAKENDLILGSESSLSFEAGSEATGWCYIGLRKMIGESGEWVTWEGSLRGSGTDWSSTAASSTGVLTPPSATSDGKAIVVSPGVAKQDAPVVEFFFDYQCPACNEFENSYGSVLTALAASGDIKLHYRTWTLLGDDSVRAGLAATCADVVGRYSDFHSQVYAHQNEDGGYTDAVLRETIPGQIGIGGDDLGTFQACYDERATEPFLTTMSDLVPQDMVTGTPTVHVNGEDLPIDDIWQVEPYGLLDLIMQLT